MRFRLHLLAVLVFFSSTTQPYSLRQTVRKRISRVYKQLLRAKEAFAIIGFFSGITLLCLWCGQHTPEQTTPSEQQNDNNNTEHEDQEEEQINNNTSTNNTTSTTPNNRSYEQRSSDPALLTEQEQQLNDYEFAQQQKAAQKLQEEQDHKMALQLQQQEQNHTNSNSRTSTRFEVPFTLREKNIAHLKSVYQENSTCGWWTLANALALQRLMNENKAINANSIANYARNYYNQMQAQHPNTDKDGWLLGDKLAQIAKSMDLANLFIITKYEPTTQDHRDGTAAYKRNVVNPFDPFGHDDHVALLKTIEGHGSGTITFAYLNGNHWVLMSMVKKLGKQSYLVYMDSRNQSLDDQEDTIRVIDNLYYQLFSNNTH